MRRRRLLRMGAVLSLPVLAGCGSGDDEGAGAPQDTERDSPTDAPTASPTARATESSGNEDGGATPTASDEPAETSTDASTETPTPEARSADVQIGEIVEGDRMSMVIRGVETTDQIGEFQEAEDGHEFHLVELVVKNTASDEYANFSSFLQTRIQDDEDYTYSPTLSVSSEAFESGQLAPGEVARGDVAFELPEDASGLTLQFDLSLFDFFRFDRITVDLGSSAGSIGDLEQSLAVPVHGVGDEVTDDDITVTVHEVNFETEVGSFTEAEEGMEFAIVDITTENGTDEEQNFSTLLQMGAKDGTGRPFSYSTSATSQLSQSYEDGTIESGGSRRGKVAFEVEEGVSPLYYTFEFGVIRSGTKTFWQVR